MKTVICTLNSRFSHTSLALRCLREAARDAGFDPELCEYTINHELRKIVADLVSKQADFYGFSVYVFNLTETLWVIRDLKRVLPSAFIFCGGPEVSFEEADFLLQNPEVDLILRGEGEKTFAELLSIFENTPKDRLLQTFFSGQTAGLSYLYNKKPVRNPDRKPECCLDCFAFPYRDEEDLCRIKDRILYYESSRGCPFGCSYCMSSLDRSVRTLSLPRTFSDLSVFLKHRVRLVKFVDRTFNADRARCMGILRFLRDHDNGVTSFHFEISPMLIDREFLSFLPTARPGMFLFEAGLQSANPKTLKAIGRRQDTAALIPLLREFSGSGAHLHLDLIAGLPYEDYASFGRSLDIAMSARPDVLQLGFLKVLKGAPIAAQKEHEMVYSPRPPYEILQNQYLSFQDLERLKKIEEILERYFNSGLFRDFLVEVSERCFGGGFFSMTESMADFLEKKDFFILSVSERTLADLLHEWLSSLSLLSDDLDNCRNLLAFDLYKKSPVPNPPAWLRNLPDFPALVSLLKNPEILSGKLPEALEGVFPGPDPKKWVRRARLVRFVIDGKEVSYLFLYASKTHIILL